MAISMFSEADLVTVSSMGIHKLRKMLGGMTLNQVLVFRRNLQISLAGYSKTHRYNKQLDTIQASIIGICHQIETMARNTFTIGCWRKKKKDMKDMTQPEKGREKAKIKDEWEKIIKRFSY